VVADAFRYSVEHGLALSAFTGDRCALRARWVTLRELAG
jgi:hypothetical protein